MSRKSASVSRAPLFSRCRQLAGSVGKIRSKKIVSCLLTSNGVASIRDQVICGWPFRAMRTGGNISLFTSGQIVMKLSSFVFLPRRESEAREKGSDIICNSDFGLCEIMGYLNNLNRQWTDGCGRRSDIFSGETPS